MIWKYKLKDENLLCWKSLFKIQYINLFTSANKYTKVFSAESIENHDKDIFNDPDYHQ